MQAHRFTIKYPFKDSPDIDLEAVTNLFHKWIQEDAVDGLLLDVADYKHVPAGPGIMLVGDKVEYNLDFENDEPGFLYIRKRALDVELEDEVKVGLERINKAASLLTDFGLSVDTTQAQITFRDRLRLPNTAEAFTKVVPLVAEAVAQVNGAATVSRVENDARGPLTVQVTGKG